jgi:hypothetical protein
LNGVNDQCARKNFKVEFPSMESKDNFLKVSENSVEKSGYGY